MDNLNDKSMATTSRSKLLKGIFAFVFGAVALAGVCHSVMAFVQQVDTESGGTSTLYNCTGGYNDLKNHWSDQRKRLCCQLHGLGCPLFNCTTGYSDWEK